MEAVRRPTVSATVRPALSRDYDVYGVRIPPSTDDGIPRDVDPTRSLAVAIETFFDVYRDVVGNLRLPDGDVGRPYDNYYALRQIATAAGSVRVELEAGLDLEMTPVRFDFATGLNTASVATALTCPADAASRSCASHRSVRGRHWA